MGRGRIKYFVFSQKAVIRISMFVALKMCSNHETLNVCDGLIIEDNGSQCDVLCRVSKDSRKYKN